METLENLFRTLMFFFDNIIYSFIPTLYGLITYLAQIDIFSTDKGIQDLMGQIYTLLGIFMLFKLSFSFLNYVINPDNLNDNSKGVGKLVINSIVVVILLVSVPYIFNIAFKLQYAVVTSNILGQLILGNSTGTQGINENISVSDFFNPNKTVYELDSEASDRLKSEAKDLQFLIYGAFFSVNYDVIPECGSNQPGEEGEGLSDSSVPTPIFGSVEMAQNGACIEKLDEYFQQEADISTNGVVLGSFFKGVNETTGEILDDNRDFSHFDKLLWWQIEDEYAINYLPLISTAAGIYIVFLLLTFCIDVASRAIKLCFLQVIAPISIVSYIDPNENARESKLGKWASTCVKTYVSLFIRLAMIFLIIRLISVIASGIFGAEGFRNNLSANEYTIWVYVFLVLGLFVFAKQVPKLLEDLLGIKSAGEFSLNPIKNIKENVGATGLLAGTAGAAVGTAITGVSAFSNSRAQGRGIARSLLSAGGGAVAGFARGGLGGLTSGGKNVLGGAFKSAGNTARKIEMRTNTTFGSRMEGAFRNMTGQQSKFEVYKNQAEVYQTIIDAKKGMEDRAKSIASRSDTYRMYEAQKGDLEERKRRGTITNASYLAQMKDLENKQKGEIQKVIDSKTDMTIEQYRKQMQRTINENNQLAGISSMETTNWDKIKKAEEEAKSRKLGLEVSDEYQDAKSVDQAIKSGAMQSWRNKQN